MPSQNTLKWLQTVNVIFIAMTYGMVIAVYGATLVDVAEVYGETVKSTSITLTARGLGSISSCLVGAFIYKSVNLQIVLIGCVVFGAVSALLTTILPSLMYLHVLSFFLGCAMGLTEIGTHVWVQVLWKERCGSLFHFINFTFGFGGIVGPFICEPFLREFDESSNSTTISTIGSFTFSTDIVSEGIAGAANDAIASTKSESHIFSAFCIIAAIHGVNALSMIVSYCLDSADFKPGKETSYFAADLPKIDRHIVRALLALYLTVGVICEFGFSAMVFAFAVSYPSLKFTKSKAAFLTSLFWASFTVSRVVTTGFSIRFSPAQLIMGSHVIYVASAIFMMLFIDTSPTLIAWLGTALVAFGLSPYWANGTAWSVQYIQLTPASLGLIMMLVSSGMMVIPFIIGNQISDNPQFFLYSNTGFALLLTALAVVLIVYGNTKRLRRHIGENDIDADETN